MATEKETIKILSLDVNADNAVKNISDLQHNISELKKALKEGSATFEENMEYTKLLRENQNALKNAMYATQGTMQDVTKAARGMGNSYNGLVAYMAELKTHLRATDTSTKEGKKAFEDYAKQIKAVNDRLKEMDEMQGNYQRNVGDYANSIKKAWGDITKKIGDGADGLRKGLGAASGGLNGFKDGMEGLGKSPALATIGILVSLFLKLAEHLKEDETAMASIRKAMDSLKPVMDFLSGILDKVINYVVELIEKVGAFLGESGIINKITSAVMGIGNTIAQFVIAPFKAVIAAVQVFQDEGIKGLRNAAKAFGQEMKSGFAFKQNFQTGQAAADAMIAGAASRRKETEQAGKDMAKSMTDGADSALADWEKALQSADRISAEMRKRKEDAEKIVSEVGKALDDITNEEINGILAEIDGAIEAEAELHEKANEQAEKQAERRKQIWTASMDAAANLFDGLADLLESDEKNGEKYAKQVKALRIASATIDTIQGAVGAFSSAAANPGGIPGMIIGAANAAAVTAMGIANIAKIRATDATGKGSASSVSTAAPAPVLAVPQVRTITTAQDETRLNEMVADQRVYILQSDLEAERTSHRVQVRESSF